MADKLTLKEIRDAFGETVPMEAMDILFNSPDEMTIEEVRQRLSDLAREWRGKAAKSADKLTREQIEEIREAALAVRAADDSPIVWRLYVEGLDIAAVIALCDMALSPALTAAREALEPFAKAAQELDADLPYGHRAEDGMSIEHALYEAEQPTVGDLRRAVAALALLKEQTHG